MCGERERRIAVQPAEHKRCGRGRYLFVCAAACEQCGVLRGVCQRIREGYPRVLFVESPWLRGDQCVISMMRECGPRYFCLFEDVSRVEGRAELSSFRLWFVLW